MTDIKFPGLEALWRKDKTVKRSNLTKMNHLGINRKVRPCVVRGVEYPTVKSAVIGALGEYTNPNKLIITKELNNDDVKESYYLPIINK